MNFNINQGGVGDQLSPTKCFVTPKKSFGHAPVSPVLCQAIYWLQIFCLFADVEERMKSSFG